MQKQLKEQIKYWHDSSLKNFEAAKSLYKLKHYDSCLFFCHLSLEKIIKGLVVINIKESAPYMHDLVRLTVIAEIEITKEQKDYLEVITGFNMAGRYNEYKLQFYKQCTKEYTQEWLAISKKLLLWLKEKYPKE